MLTLGGDGLDRFLTDLVNDWQGWNGIRRWDALENGMSIEATHHRNRVELLFIVRRDYNPDAWEARLPILVAPGESLARLANAVADLLQAVPMQRPGLRAQRGVVLGGLVVRAERVHRVHDAERALVLRHVRRQLLALHGHREVDRGRAE